MSGRRAKIIRRAIYGDQAHATRQYVVTQANDRTVFNHPASLRALYLAAKVAWLA